MAHRPTIETDTSSGASPDATGPLSGSICLVEPDPGVRSALLALLGGLSAPVVGFENGEDLLFRLEEGRPVCLITELVLPGMSGFDLAHVVRKRGFHVPVIGLTGRASRARFAEATRLGFLDLLEKPFVDRSLVKQLETLLESEI